METKNQACRRLIKFWPRLIGLIQRHDAPLCYQSRLLIRDLVSLTEKSDRMAKMVVWIRLMVLIDRLYFEAGNSSNFFTLENKVYIFGLDILFRLNIEITGKYTIPFWCH